MLKKNNLPVWFNIWWAVNIVIAVLFIIYWYINDFDTDRITSLFTLYACLWGLWAAKYRRKEEIID